MNMKKLLAFMLAVIMLISMVACSSDSDDDDEDDDEPKKKVTVKADDDDEDDPDEKDEDKDKDKDKDKDDEDDEDDKEKVTQAEKEEEEEPKETDPEEEEEPEETEPEESEESEDEDEPSDEYYSDFEPVTFIDNDDCLIKAVSMRYDDLLGTVIKFSLENRSDDMTYLISIDSASVNGVEMSVLLMKEVKAGKKVTEEVNLFMSGVEDAGMTEVTDLEFEFSVVDNDNWFADPVAKVDGHIYPKGEDRAEKHVREPKSTDIVALDNDDVKVVVTDYVKTTYAHEIKLYIENKTDKKIRYTSLEFYVNGTEISSLLMDTIGAGKCQYASIYLYAENLEEENIKEIEEIEFDFEVTYEGEWLSEPLFSDVLKIKF